MSNYADNVLPGPGLEPRRELERDILAAFLSQDIKGPARERLGRVEAGHIMDGRTRSTFLVCRELENGGVEVTPESVANLAGTRGQTAAEVLTLVELTEVARNPPAANRIGQLVDRLVATDAYHRQHDIHTQLQAATERATRDAAAGADLDEVNATIARLQRQLDEAPKAVDWGDLIKPWHAVGGEPVRYLVDRLLYASTVAVLVGKPAAGKTFAAVGLACSVATGRDYLGHLVRKPGPVLYIAAEGLATMNERIEAWRRHHEVNTDELDELHVFDTDALGIALSNPAHLAGLVEGMRRRKIEPSLIVVDTWAMAAGLYDENSNAEAGTVASALVRLAANTGACVLIVHHPTKGSNGDLRGASALEGSVRVVLELTGDKVLRHRKNNLGPKVERVQGDLVSVPEVRMVPGQPPESVAVFVQADTTTAKVSDTEVLELLDELGARSAPVATGVALEAAAERWSMGRSTFYKVRGRLVEAGLVTTGNNGVMRIPATAPTF